MREILFRGKTIDSGEWLKGDLHQYQSEVIGNIHDNPEFLESEVDTE